MNRLAVSGVRCAYCHEVVEVDVTEFHVRSGVADGALVVEVEAMGVHRCKPLKAE